MEKIITIKSEYDSLHTFHVFLKKATAFECSKDYVSWDVRTDKWNNVL